MDMRQLMLKKALKIMPEHLLEHVAEQKYELYTAIDHASWRYIMRVSKAFFKNHAHKKYLSGLEQTGITTDRIPRISEMDAKLKKIGWRAVTVTGFIPPAVFLEFQSLSVLPIACDMRRLEHLEYTPSPDIVHEAAGHAPIIADPAYARYLHKFGEIARKAIFAKEDLEIYDAIKYLSDIKEDPRTTAQEIDAAYKRLSEAYGKVRFVSEASKLSRLGWWSIEYGLIKTGREFKIYGAGLLSSVSESYNAIHGNVKKVPLTLKCVDTDYDITKPQPQLFYVEKFKQLEKVIDQLADTMAYRVGGMPALNEALRAGTVNTVGLDSGLQISGVLKEVLTSGSGAKASPIYLQFTGPTQLSYGDVELSGHSAKYHGEGFGTPVGVIAGLKKSAAKLNKKDLAKMGFRGLGAGATVGEMRFESGVVVRGKLKSVLAKRGVNLIISFSDCTVQYGDKVLFNPSWGVFDMACGRKVATVYGGAADRAAYLKSTGQFKAELKAQTSNLTHEHEELLPLYERVRAVREGMVARRAGVAGGSVIGGLGLGALVEEENFIKLKSVSAMLEEKYSSDWLLRLEIVEILSSQDFAEHAAAQKLKKEILNQLGELAGKTKVLSTLVERGLELI
jgi:phenylalanine-4-hydroxylase